MNLSADQLQKLKVAYVDTLEPKNTTHKRALIALKAAHSRTNRDDWPSVSLKHFEPDVHCFSDLTTDELKEFSRFCKTVMLMREESDLRVTSFACTTIENKDPLSKAFADKLGVGQLSHYKLSEKARIHGAWFGKRFKLIIIDPNHQVHV